MGWKTIISERRAAVRKTDQSKSGKSRKFEVVERRELAVHLCLPLAEVWEELQAEVERLSGAAGLRIMQEIWNEEVRQRVGLRHHPDPASGALRWGRQPG